jgi:hypothetical protein
VRAKPFADVTVRELAAARRHELDPEGDGPPPRPEVAAHAAAAARGQRAMRATLDRSNAARATFILASRDGDVTFDVRGVGPAALRAVADALAATR